jgi:HEAT repeat protein
MKRFFFMFAVLAALLPALRAADMGEEPLIAVLQSDATPQQKDAACAQLTRLGTARAVPALAALLADEQLSHSARYALETMPLPEAGRTLIAALDKTTGLTRVGIITSLGYRRETAALPALAKLVADGDPQVASAAAVALGKIGGPDAVNALKAARAGAPAAVQSAIADGLLRCAAHLLGGTRSPNALAARTDAAAASEIYKNLLNSKEPRIRTAAAHGLIVASDQDAAVVAQKMLAGDDPYCRIAALQLVARIPGGAATALFAESLPSLPADIQVAVIDALRQRGDAAAIPALLQAAKSSSEAVRIAALRALGALGDAPVILTLAEAAAGNKGSEQETARASLSLLRGKGICKAMLADLDKANPEVQTELILALGMRREVAAVPKLLKLAGSAGATQRAAALLALSTVADENAAGDLVALLVKAGNDDERDAVEKTLTAICARSKRSEACAAPVLKAIPGAGVPARCALLRVLGQVAGDESLRELRAAARDSDATLQDAAIRSLAAAGRADAMPDLLALAKDAPTLPHRVIALRGYWHAVALADTRPVAERLSLCEAGFAASQRADEKRLGLTALAKISDPGAVKLAERFLADDAVRAEAAHTLMQIAREASGANRAAIKTELTRLLAAASDDATRKAAEAALVELEPDAGCIVAWEVAGPYAQAGKKFNALFDIPFPPETPGAADVKWRALPSGASPGKPWLLDLLKFFGGGEQCVAYARTSIHSGKAQPARLDIGSDDGVKVWLNGELVHANNVARPLRPGQDKAAIQLKQGWNTLLLKITQNNLGWEFSVRIVKPDGTPLPGLRADAAGH